MTPSSKSEPELEAKPAQPDPTETIDLTSANGAPATEDTAAATVVDEPVAASAPTTKVPKDAPAAAPEPEPAVKESPVPAESGTDSVTDSEPVDDEEEEAGDEDVEVLEAQPADRHATLIPLVGSLLGLTALVALVLIAFALPAVKSEPHRLPIGVAGSAETNDQLQQLFAANDSTTFDVTSFSDESKLRSAIENREIYGGLSVSETGVTMLVSTGASPASAETLNSVANSLSAQAGNQIPVTDVAAMPAGDPRGEGLAAANIPLVVAGIFPALVLIPLYPRRKGTQLAITAAASIPVALGLSAVLNYAVGSTEGSNFLLVTVGLAAGVLATSLLLLGLFAVAGRVGFAVGAALLVLLAAPLSGLATAPEWLPSPWGAIGQLLPAGANVSLLRSTAYFDGQGFGGPVLVLAGWALIGLLLFGFSVLLARRTAKPPVAA